MPAEATARRLMTLDDFYEWEGAPETRYELIDGVPMAMTSPSIAHGAIATRLAWGLTEALKARPSCLAVTEVGILSPTRANTYYQADLALSCTPQDPDRHEMTNPLLIIEVLSATTEDQDRKVKLVEYRQIPSVREVLLVDSKRPYLELHRRVEGDRWMVELIVDPNASVRLESIDTELALVNIYANLLA